MKKKLVTILIIGGVAILGAGILVVALNIKTVKVSSDLSCRVMFGRMSDGEAKRVLAEADGKLMPGRKYPFARDAYRAVVEYHAGSYRDDACLGVARTFLGEGKRAEAYPWLEKVAKEYPRGSAVESRAFDRAVAAELGLMLAKPPLDYVNAARYLDLLAAAGSPDAATWRQKFKDIVETPFSLAANYTHEKELAYVVKDTATRDATSAALFYAREHVPDELVRELKKRVQFGAAVPDDKLKSFVEGRVAYGGQVDKVGKKDLDEQAKVKLEKEREEKGLGELPVEWADAFAGADEDTGWTASASVTGSLKNVTIAEILTACGVDPLTGKELVRK